MIKVTMVYEIDDITDVVDLLHNAQSEGMVHLEVINPENENDAMYSGQVEKK